MLLHHRTARQGAPGPHDEGRRAPGNAGKAAAEGRERGARPGIGSGPEGGRGPRAQKSQRRLALKVWPMSSLKVSTPERSITTGSSRMFCALKRSVSVSVGYQL